MNKVQTNIEGVGDVALFAMEYLGIDGVTLCISQNYKFLRRLSSDNCEYEALLYKSPLEKSYNLIVRDERPKLNVICHECVHLKQYEDGRLSIDPETGCAIWEGEHFSNHTNYVKRPWEREAFDMDFKVAREYRKNRHIW